ncbi:emp24p/erv25p- protein [Apophysomyces ossiformis]|uniref:Emp24p/erv25p- protein n=1 Tax=Apophysomyces ossiformis TaxID=679940 RepID=A0A8H7BH76_9FUNG|nr:emp24p/erv25p- protein [Apophysomyces ossiformis]
MDFDDPQSDHHDHTETLKDVALRIHELNERVQDIRRDQTAQREREAELRDQSELTNSRVVWWTIVQIVVLGVVCFWQMRHFKSFFVAKKLV